MMKINEIGANNALHWTGISLRSNPPVSSVVSEQRNAEL
jgi:hypothetical protein